MGTSLYNMYKYLTLLLFLAGCTSKETSTITDETDLLKAKIATLAEVLIEPSQEKINALVHADLSYGHSSGKIENKEQFADALLNGKDDILTWNMSDIEMKQADKTAWIRHNLEAAVLTEGDTNHIALKVLTIWTKDQDNWKLLARQAVK